MNLLESIFLGFIQGITEFLPVSSSGHLAIFENLFHIDTDTGVLFDVMLHVGTLAAIFLVYWRDIKKMFLAVINIIIDIFRNLFILLKNVFHNEHMPYKRIVSTSYRKFVVMIIISTIPTGIVGYVLKDIVEIAKTELLIPGLCLMITGCVLLLALLLPRGNKTPKDATYSGAFTIGMIQAIATLPGISRSGATITACLANGYSRKFAVKYSFIISIPAIVGATILSIAKSVIGVVSAGILGNYAAGMITSAIVGFVCIKTMMVVVKNYKYGFFAIFCFLLGAVSIAGYFLL